MNKVLLLLLLLSLIPQKFGPASSCSQDWRCSLPQTGGSGSFPWRGGFWQKTSFWGDL